MSEDCSSVLDAEKELRKLSENGNDVLKSNNIVQYVDRTDHLLFACKHRGLDESYLEEYITYCLLICNKYNVDRSESDCSVPAELLLESNHGTYAYPKIIIVIDCNTKSRCRKMQHVY